MFDTLGAVELGEQATHRVAALETVGAVRRHEQHAGELRSTGEHGEQVACRPIGPVDVLDDEHHRLRLGRPGAAPPAAPRPVGRRRRRDRRAGRAPRGSGRTGAAPSATSRQCPVSTTAPADAARLPSSATRRDLPIPASPPTSTAAEDPAIVASRATIRCRSSSVRPTNHGHDIREAIDHLPAPAITPRASITEPTRGSRPLPARIPVIDRLRLHGAGRSIVSRISGARAARSAGGGGTRTP